MPFGFSIDLELRFAETDAQGIAHHAVYLVWFEVARIGYLGRFRGGYPGLRESGVDAITTEAYVGYRAAIRFPSTLRIFTRCAHVRGARFRFEYEVERDGTLVAEGWTGHACVDATTLRPTRVPEWLADAIATAEA